MLKLRSLLDHSLAPGIYVLDAEVDLTVIADETRQAGYNFYYIDGRKIVSEEDFFREAQRVLGFPDYFGHNWDAFDECIVDLSWLPAANGTVIFHDHFERFAESNPEDFRLAYYGLAYATRRNTHHLSCYILLQGDEKLLPERPGKMQR